ncbi:hypothetical protein AA0115_g4709 [Alternaria tenuissima]|uniref:Heterokaryon incompatibility domain-containing protein n=1 Tax=Alternaria tenuissima TaxID=119927 RepID=A0AB37WLQ2_9PLEO|nr:hypothetical protein AA0115_g4709 [Alternaria tenuissima]
MCAHHRTLETLEMSAAQGCHICQAFWLQVSETEQDALRAAETKRLLATPGRPPEKPEPDNLEEYFEWLTFTLLLKEPWGLGVDYVLMLKFSGEGVDWRSVSPKDTPALGFHTFQICFNRQLTQAVNSYSTDSDEFWATAMTWFDQCVKTHVKCNPNRDRPAWYPTRLLDLGSGQNDNQILRLIQTADESMSGPYVTLSHCSGKSQFIQLNKNTSASLRSGVSIEVMPKTFREAILTTRRFGTRYIWIDSMCIQQVWMHMGEDCSRRWLTEHNEKDDQSDWFHEAELCVADIDESRSHIQCDIHNYFFWSHNIPGCIINKRAWVVQERLLAPRVLCFGHSQLLWECMEHDASESYPNRLPDFFQKQVFTNFKALDADTYIRKIEAQGRQVDGNVACYVIWNKIISAYSETLLTVATDKLIALSGIAKRMRPTVNNDTYVAGIWRKHLESALLWLIKTHEKIDGSPSCRPTPYRAPTWSWASVDGVMVTEAVRSKSEWAIEVVDHHLKYATNDTTGVVTGGWLDLQGALKPLGVTHETQDRWRMLVNNVLVRPQDDSLPDWKRIGPLVHLDVPATDDAFVHDMIQQRLFFMIARTPESDNEYIPILLLRLCDAERRLFERIGIATGGPKGGTELLLAELDEETRASLPCLRYEKGLHTVRMI